jgi:hypothetical protein
MSTTNFTQFDVATPLIPTDYIVGFRADETTELKATLNQVIDLVGANETLQISSVQIRTRPTANVFIGDTTTGNLSASGNHNFVFGQSAGCSLTTGGRNNFLGVCAGRQNTTGGCNNFLGNGAGLSNTTGSYNNFFGNCAGCTNTQGSNNIIIGNTADVATNSLSGVIVIGTSATAQLNNELSIGSSIWPLSTVSDNTFTNQISSVILRLNGSLFRVPIIPV